MSIYDNLRGIGLTEIITGRIKMFDSKELYKFIKERYGKSLILGLSETEMRDFIEATDSGNLPTSKPKEKEQWNENLWK